MESISQLTAPDPMGRFWQSSGPRGWAQRRGLAGVCRAVEDDRRREAGHAEVVRRMPCVPGPRHVAAPHAAEQRRRLRPVVQQQRRRRGAWQGPSPYAAGDLESQTGKCHMNASVRTHHMNHPYVNVSFGTKCVENHSIGLCIKCFLISACLLDS